MLPVQVSPNVLAEIAVSLDSIASSLRDSISTTGSDFGMVDPSGPGFEATHTTDVTIGAAIRTLTSIETDVAATAAAMRHAAAAYAGVDGRAGARLTAPSW